MRLGCFAVGWLCLTSLACGPRPEPRYASLGGKWIAVAGAGDPSFFGVVDAPKEGQPLSPLPCAPAPPACVTDDDIASHLGPVCNHESEGGSPHAIETGPSSAHARHGIAPPTREVRWYCAGATVIRVVLEPCTPTTFRPVQIAFTTR